MKKLPLLLFLATPAFALACSQVTCDEARNYPQMDRDNDGYYCEAQCGNYIPKKAATKTTKTTTTKITPVTKAVPKTTVKSKYILGPKGGCYYVNKNGNKTYVDKKYCAK